MQVEHEVEPWTGVRSHQAKRNLAAMAVGDLVFFYHSNVGKEIVGVVEVVRAAYPDPTADSGDWVVRGHEDGRSRSSARSRLAEMKADPALEGFALLKYSRLSVVPVEPIGRIWIGGALKYNCA